MARTLETYEDGALVSTEVLDSSPSEINAPIYAQLDELDRKSIRALREGDAARVAQIEAQATALRTTLVK